MNIRLQKFPLILIIVFLCIATFAADKIEGAFGMKLGDTFDPSSAIRILEGKDGIPSYQFNTTNAFRSFKNYFVMVTPKTHQIYSIWAVGKIGDLQAGKEEQAKVMELLRKQFGNDEAPTDMEIHQGNRLVATKLVGNVDVTIAILYTDSDLKALADKERLTAK
ncbi:MAG TPA: hypothetical protein VHG89_00060 [Verrucomicrobiae bacterium]|nr:hypothetical protein [Verrucomicrobiae bacterium]